MMRQILIIKYRTLTPYSANFSVPLFLRFAQIMYLLHTPCSKTNHPIMKKEETPQVLPRSQASQVSATRSLYFILLSLILPVKQFLQFSIVYADVIYYIPLFCNGNGLSVSIPTTGTGLRSLFRPYIHPF